MSSAYVVEDIDVSVAREKTPITSSLAAEVYGVYVAILPGVASLHFGQGGQPIPVVQGKYYKCPCQPERDGIFVTNAAAAGHMLVMVAYSAGPIEVSGQDETPVSAVKSVYARGAQAGSVNSGPIIQLWNPPTVSGVSPRNLVVERAVANTGAVGRVSVALMRRQLSNNGGGVLTNGAARFLDRRLAPADPIALIRDAGILGVIAGSTFDNLFYSELGGTFQIPQSEELYIAFFTGNNANEELITKEQIVLSPGWGMSMQHSQNGAGVQMSGFFIASPQ